MRTKSSKEVSVVVQRMTRTTMNRLQTFGRLGDTFDSVLTRVLDKAEANGLEVLSIAKQE